MLHNNKPVQWSGSRRAISHACVKELRNQPSDARYRLLLVQRRRGPQQPGLNLAAHLAGAGQHVGIMDMDLEAPGLTLCPALEPAPQTLLPNQGLMDFSSTRPGPCTKAQARRRRYCDAGNQGGCTRAGTRGEPVINGYFNPHRPLARRRAPGSGFLGPGATVSGKGGPEQGALPRENRGQNISMPGWRPETLKPIPRGHENLGGANPTIGAGDPPGEHPLFWRPGGAHIWGKTPPALFPRTQRGGTSQRQKNPRRAEKTLSWGGASGRWRLQNR